MSSGPVYYIRNVTFTEQKRVNKSNIHTNRPGYNKRMYWTNFRQSTAHVQQNIVGKSLIEACSPYLYASFCIFYSKIGQLLEAQWVFEAWLKIDN